LKQTPNGYIIFDDTTLDKRQTHEIALAKTQYSGNAHGVINGIDVIPCVYVNPELDLFWLIDFRIYDKQGDCFSEISIQCLSKEVKQDNHFS
jgi:hypothetical protein